MRSSFPSGPGGAPCGPKPLDDLQATRRKEPPSSRPAADTPPRQTLQAQPLFLPFACRHLFLLHGRRRNLPNLTLHFRKDWRKTAETFLFWGSSFGRIAGGSPEPPPAASCVACSLLFPKWIGGCKPHFGLCLSREALCGPRSRLPPYTWQNAPPTDPWDQRPSTDAELSQAKDFHAREAPKAPGGSGLNRYHRSSPLRRRVEA